MPCAETWQGMNADWAEGSVWVDGGRRVRTYGEFKVT